MNSFLKTAFRNTFRSLRMAKTTRDFIIALKPLLSELYITALQLYRWQIYSFRRPFILEKQKKQTPDIALAKQILKDNGYVIIGISTDDN